MVGITENVIKSASEEIENVLMAVDMAPCMGVYF
jgi:hypothetical protein